MTDSFLQRDVQPDFHNEDRPSAPSGLKVRPCDGTRDMTTRVLFCAPAPPLPSPLGKSGKTPKYMP